MADRKLNMREAGRLILRLAITAGAFAWVIRKVEGPALLETLRTADLRWLWISVGLFFFSQAGCIVRWKTLAPKHPAVTYPLLTRSFFVASFFNTFLPTTIGGDVIRGYDLIKATADWRQSLASVLMDRLLGFAGLLISAGIAWLVLPAARQDALFRAGFTGLCLMVLATTVVLGSRRVLRMMLKPFAKIGLGQLQSHARQFQESLLAYGKHPSVLLRGLAVTAVIHVSAIFMFAAAARALNIEIPLGYFFLVVPIILTVSQVPVSLNGWGVREWATVSFLGRIGVSAHEAFLLSVICAVIPFLSGGIGAALFLLSRRRRRPASL